MIDGTVYVGLARSIGDERGNFGGRDDDIRDEYLRVTLLLGFDVAWPMSELLSEVGSGYFVPNYQD